MNERLLRAKTEGRLAKLEFSNDLNMPITVAINRTNTRLVTEHKLKRLELHFITRRSTLNPGEVAKLYLITEAPLVEYESSAYLYCAIGETVTGLWWCLPLNGDGEQKDWRGWLKRKKQEAKS